MPGKNHNRRRSGTFENFDKRESSKATGSYEKKLSNICAKLNKKDFKALIEIMNKLGGNDLRYLADNAEIVHVYYEEHYNTVKINSEPQIREYIPETVIESGIVPEIVPQTVRKSKITEEKITKLNDFQKEIFGGHIVFEYKDSEYVDEHYTKFIINSVEDGPNAEFKRLYNLDRGLSGTLNFADIYSKNLPQVRKAFFQHMYCVVICIIYAKSGAEYNQWRDYVQEYAHLKKNELLELLAKSKFVPQRNSSSVKHTPNSNGSSNKLKGGIKNYGSFGKKLENIHNGNSDNNSKKNYDVNNNNNYVRIIPAPVAYQSNYSDWNNDTDLGY